MDTQMDKCIFWKGSLEKTWLWLSMQEYYEITNRKSWHTLQKYNHVESILEIQACQDIR